MKKEIQYFQYFIVKNDEELNHCVVNFLKDARVYSCEEIMNEYVLHTHDKMYLQEYVNKLLENDKIAIKWVQFLNGKENFQKWFANIINEFLDKEKQVFLFGDRSESEIELFGKLNNNTICFTTVKKSN